MSQRLKLKVKEIEWLTKKVINLKFDVIEPEEFTFIPGQHINLIVADKTPRSYCLNSDSRNKSSIGIAVSVGHDGKGSNFLRKLKVGDGVEAFGAVGRLKMPQEHKKNILFVGTGTGISPMISILKEMQALELKSSIRLYFGIRDLNNMIFEDELNKFKKDFSDFDYKLVLSRPDDGWEGLVGYVDEHIEIEDLENTQAYVIGHDKMVDKVVEDLLEAGIKEEDIIT